MRIIFLLSALLFSLACGEKADPQDKFRVVYCDTNEGCAEGFICEKNACTKGERPKVDEEAIKKAKAKALAAKRAIKPGEGRLKVRVCPIFKNTPEALGTLTAKHIKSGKEHYIHMARVVKDGGWQDVFTFWSLPLGEYTVTASYGIQVKGRADTVKLKCHKKVIKNKKECKEEIYRLRTVALPPAVPVVPKKDKDGKEIKMACDWIVE